MKYTKAILLFLALILPICIFLFLKFFGKNEFAVKPLYADSFPEIPVGCTNIEIPYAIHDSIRNQLPWVKDSLVILSFDSESVKSTNQMKRIEQEVTDFPVSLLTLSASERHLFWRNCVFFLKEPFDMVLVDAHGRLRGQYQSGDREDIDRLLTELTIILKRY